MVKTPLMIEQERTSEKRELQEDCDRMKQCAKAVGGIADILKDCEDKAEARRIIIAAGLTAGVYDVDENGTIVRAGAD